MNAATTQQHDAAVTGSAGMVATEDIGSQTGFGCTTELLSEQKSYHLHRLTALQAGKAPLVAAKAVGGGDEQSVPTPLDGSSDAAVRASCSKGEIVGASTAGLTHHQGSAARAGLSKRGHGDEEPEEAQTGRADPERTPDAGSGQPQADQAAQGSMLGAARAIDVIASQRKPEEPAGSRAMPVGREGLTTAEVAGAVRHDSWYGLVWSLLEALKESDGAAGSQLLRSPAAVESVRRELLVAANAALKEVPSLDGTSVAMLLELFAGVLMHEDLLVPGLKVLVEGFSPILTSCTVCGKQRYITQLGGAPHLQCGDSRCLFAERTCSYAADAVREWHLSSQQRRDALVHIRHWASQTPLRSHVDRILTATGAVAEPGSSRRPLGRDSEAASGLSASRVPGPPKVSAGPQPVVLQMAAAASPRAQEAVFRANLASSAVETVSSVTSTSSRTAWGPPERCAVATAPPAAVAASGKAAGAAPRQLSMRFRKLPLAGGQLMYQCLQDDCYMILEDLSQAKEHAQLYHMKPGAAGAASRKPPGAGPAGRAAAAAKLHLERGSRPAELAASGHGPPLEPAVPMLAAGYAPTLADPSLLRSSGGVRERSLELRGTDLAAPRFSVATANAAAGLPHASSREYFSTQELAAPAALRASAAPAAASLLDQRQLLSRSRMLDDSLLTSYSPHGMVVLPRGDPLASHLATDAARADLLKRPLDRSGPGADLLPQPTLVALNGVRSLPGRPAQLSVREYTVTSASTANASV